jgi:hypothetical protein
MVRTYTCRLYPTAAQAAALSERLDATNELYNATLRELYQVWAEHGRLPGSLERGRGAVTATDDVRHRAEQAFRAFVLKCQRTRDRRDPPVRAREHWVSVAFEEWSACGRGRLELPGIGAVAVDHRQALPVCSAAVTVKQRGTDWQACFRHGEAAMSTRGRSRSAARTPSERLELSEARVSS